MTLMRIERLQQAGRRSARADATPLLAGLAAASVEGRVAGGRTVQRLGDPREGGEVLPPSGCHARANGFDLHAGLMVPAGQRDRLERVCQYVLRPPGGVRSRGAHAGRTGAAAVAAAVG